MRTKAKRAAAVIGALLLAAMIVYFYFGFNGSYLLGTHYKKKVEEYVRVNYPHQSYQVSDYQYDFKDGSYYYEIMNPDDVTDHFRLYYCTDHEIRQYDITY